MSEAKNIPSKLQDDPKAPEIYATAATGFFNANGIISITLESARADHSKSPAPVNRVVVGRVVLPAAGAQALAVGLFDFLEKQGFKFKK
ncbi:MAG: hypothetical protein JO256_14470 [Alphaproteobacteria bacterium]|nr:hypothetical protein [Alphaproteobacteria bacterium]